MNDRMHLAMEFYKLYISEGVEDPSYRKAIREADDFLAELAKTAEPEAEPTIEEHAEGNTVTVYPCPKCGEADPEATYEDRSYGPFAPRLRKSFASEPEDRSYGPFAPRLRKSFASEPEDPPATPDWCWHTRKACPELRGYRESAHNALSRAEAAEELLKACAFAIGTEETASVPERIRHLKRTCHSSLEDYVNLNAAWTHNVRKWATEIGATWTTGPEAILAIDKAITQGVKDAARVKELELQLPRPGMAATLEHELAAAHRRIKELEADLAVAAKDLPVPLPEPGTDMARLLSANVLMRRRVAELEAALQTARTEGAREERERIIDALCEIDYGMVVGWRGFKREELVQVLEPKP